MNDLFIIIVCIFFILLIWTFYFKYKLREGNDPNATTIPNSEKKFLNDTYIEGSLISKGITNEGDVYVTGEAILENTTVNGKTYLNQDSYLNGISNLKDTNVNGTANLNGITNLNDTNIKGTTNLNGITNLNDTNVNGTANLNGITNLKDTNVNGHVRIPKNTPIEFGFGENKVDNAGKITYGTFDDNALCILGGGKYPNKNVHIWDDLIVDRDLNVNRDLNVINDLNSKGNINVDKDLNSKGNINVNNGNINISNWHGLFTNWFRINNTSWMQGIQMGRVFNRIEGIVNFDTPFVNDNVFVFINKFDSQSNDVASINVWQVNRNGFTFKQRCVWDGGWSRINIGNPSTPFFWIAFCS